jgi:hypothetical protein
VRPWCWRRWLHARVRGKRWRQWTCPCTSSERTPQSRTYRRVPHVPRLAHRGSGVQHATWAKIYAIAACARTASTARKGWLHAETVPRVRPPRPAALGVQHVHPVNLQAPVAPRATVQLRRQPQHRSRSQSSSQTARSTVLAITLTTTWGQSSPIALRSFKRWLLWDRGVLGVSTTRTGLATASISSSSSTLN